MTLTPKQLFLARYIGATDGSRILVPGLRGPQINSLLTAIEAGQVLTAEGIQKGWIAPPNGIASDPPIDADFAAVNSTQTAVGWTLLTAGLLGLNSALTANSNALMNVLYSARS